MKHKEKRITIADELGITKAVYEARIITKTAGFGETKQYTVSTAVSELARNIYQYAMKGEIILKIIEKNNNKGIEVTAQDNGPGIKDLSNAMKDHFSTAEGLGLGLPGVKRLMDEFVVDTKRKHGTKIITRKWV